MGLKRSKIILDTYIQINSLSAKLRPLSGKALIEEQNLSFTFPAVTEKEESWSVAPHTNVLPSRFVVVTRNANAYRHIVVGNTIPEQLQLGMNPESFKFEKDKDNPYQVDENGNLTLEPGIQWLTNYEEAVNNGMGITIPLTESEATNGFDQVFVLGIKNKTETESKELVEKLFENHHYSADGMNFLPIGTPTNNTDREKAGFGSGDDNVEEAYHMEIGQPLFDASENDRFKKSDGQRMAEVLGINPEVFQHIGNSELTQISEAHAMHTAL